MCYKENYISEKSHYKKETRLINRVSFLHLAFYYWCGPTSFTRVWFNLLLTVPGRIRIEARYRILICRSLV